MYRKVAVIVQNSFHLISPVNILHDLGTFVKTHVLSLFQYPVKDTTLLLVKFDF